MFNSSKGLLYIYIFSILYLLLYLSCSVVGWFVSGFGLRLPQPVAKPKDDPVVSYRTPVVAVV